MPQGEQSDSCIPGKQKSRKGYKTTILQYYDKVITSEITYDKVMTSEITYDKVITSVITHRPSVGRCPPPCQG